METQSIERSQRINLGAGDISMSESTARKLSYLAGTLMITSSVFYFISFITGGDLGWRLISSVLFFISGTMFLLKAHFELSPTSKYASHFIISENVIKIKTGVFKKSQFINWDDIKKIELGYYKIGIKDKTGLQFYPYATRKQTSIQIKRAIEAVATQKGIAVENLLKR